MSVQVLNIKLQRTNAGVSWGFVIQGGKEFYSPFMIQKVHPGSLADQASVRQGDYILRIGNQVVEHFTHSQARETITAQGNYLELTIQRGAAPRSEDYSFNFAFPQHRLMNSDALNQEPHYSPQVGIQLGKDKALLTQSYNSPMNLYSNQNIAETLETTMKNMNINDQTYLQEARKVRKDPAIEPVPKPLISINKHNLSPKSPTTQYKPYQQPVKPHSPIKPYQPNSYNQPGYKPGAVNRGQKGSAILNQHNHGANQPQCASCFQIIRGPFISAVGKIWCPNHFVCANQSCGTSLLECGFVEEGGKLYCEKDYAAFLAPKCHKCHNTIMAECCYALDKTFHPECFVCVHCKKIVGNGNFHIEDGMVYCERDFSALFSVKCAGCQFPIEAGDKFLEAINEKWHVECFICSKCNVPLSGGFAVKGNKPFCKKHAY